MAKTPTLHTEFDGRNRITLATEDCLKFLKTIADASVQLVVTSPPYNIGKEYEERLSKNEYKEFIGKVIAECVRIVKPGGSICWEVGTHMEGKNRPKPLAFMLHPIFESYEETDDLFLRNAIVWTYGHGLHSKLRFSGRYETILWYTKGEEYTFNLDDVRVPQMYPGKTHFKGEKKGQPSGNPKGKNPSDVWNDIPNVKANHVEKTDHPCQFPVGLAKRLILALSDKNDLVVDPFMGVGTTAVAAAMTGRRVAGCDLDSSYIRIARDRVKKALEGELPVRGDGPVKGVSPGSAVVRVPDGFWRDVSPDFAAAAGVQNREDGMNLI